MAFSRAQAAFAAALRAQIAAAKLRGIVDPGMGPVLFTLEQRGVATMSELAAAAGVPRSTMTGVAARMKKRGLVRMSDDPRDGRGIVVALTPKGQATVPRVRAIEGRLDAAFRRELDEDQLAALARYLERLASALASL
jgi:DNA-binding MarR family transcriptional regulator